MGCFCFVSFIVNFTFFSLESSGKLATKCSAVFLIALSVPKIKLNLKLLILGAFFGPYHKHLLSLSNESMTSIAYLKSFESERISYTTYSINREKGGYNLILHFVVRTLFSIYTFLWLGERAVTRKSVTVQMISLFTIQ